MVNHSNGLHHQHIRKRIHQKFEAYPHPNTFIRWYDRFIYGVAILAPITNLPQLVKVWIDKDASGVSSLSWFLFSIISVTWLIYGILHKDKHIILMYCAVAIVQVMIALGAVRFG